MSRETVSSWFVTQRAALCRKPPSLISYSECWTNDWTPATHTFLSFPKSESFKEISTKINHLPYLICICICAVCEYYTYQTGECVFDLGRWAGRQWARAPQQRVVEDSLVWKRRMWRPHHRWRRWVAPCCLHLTDSWSQTEWCGASLRSSPSTPPLSEALCR